MAKGKGKSERRIKDWQQRWHEEHEYEDDKARREKFTKRQVKLPARRLEERREDFEDLPRAEGMIVGHFPGGAVVLIEGKAVLCAISGTFRAPAGSTALAVGDVVTVATARPEHIDGRRQIDRDMTEGVILQRRQRRTALSRPQPRSSRRRDGYQGPTFEKVIVANMDTLLIVASTCQPPLRHGLIDRFLIIAERGELKPVLVINKTDLASPDKRVLADFKALGVELFLTSAVKGKGLRKLLKRLKGTESVLAGASGVGKSTLINAIIPDAEAATQPIRVKDQRGRHTTSSAVVYDVPGGGMIVDTPGMRELGIPLGPTELGWYFPEFEALAGQCKFRNCTHTHEPDCAVARAVEAGKVPRRRYDSYLDILATMEE